MPAVEQLWSYGETGYHSLAAAVVKQRYKREAMASAFRILGEGQLSLTKFLLVTDRHVDVQELQGDARAHPRAHAAGDRSLRVLEPVDGHARLHRTDGERRVEGRVARARRSGARAAAPVHARPACRRASRDVRVFCGGCLVVGGAVATRRSPARRRGSRPIRRSPDWPLVVVTDEPARAAAQRHELPVDDVHALRAGGRHPRRRPAHRPQPHRLPRPDRHRRAAEAVVSRRS